MLTAVIIVMAALFLSGCASGRKLEKSATERQMSAADSMVSVSVKRREAVKVPPSETNLKISVPDLTALPEGAEFSNRQGQASVRIRHGNDTVYVDAMCDSLQLLCEQYEERIDALWYQLNLQQSHEEVTKPPNGKSWWKLVLGSFIAGIVTTIVIIFKPRKKNE